MSDALQHMVALFGSQAAIGRALGVGRSTVNYWTRAPLGIPLERRLELVELCRQQGLPVDVELLLGERVTRAAQPLAEAA